jgi:hypothetical protein
MKIAFLSGATVLLLTQAVSGQGTKFLPHHLAVLRAGDGVMSLTLRQAPIFIDQFALDVPSAAPGFSVPVPTNGPNSFFFNGHAATEGNLTRSIDHKLLAFAGYGGVNLLQINGTASRVGLQHGICTVDSSGRIQTLLYLSDNAYVKRNARGVATDGRNNFWGCGNANGTFYYHPTDSRRPVRFSAFPNSRAIKIINNSLYASINAADGYVSGDPEGIYSFQPVALPRDPNSSVKLVVSAAPAYERIVGFDINPQGNVAYMSDTAAGVQKYVKTGDDWKFAYNFAIPQQIPKGLNNAAGCFGLAVDFSHPAPVIYATTTEGYGGSVNSNRVIRIVDTNSTALVMTLIQANSTNIAFRGLDFTPD